MKNVGVIFGGISVEHEVSVISSLQAAASLDTSKYRPIPIYISKQGTWFTGKHLLDPTQYQNLERALKAATPIRLVQNELKQVVITEIKHGIFSKPKSYLIDVCLLGLHGSEGENGSLQGFCETLNVPYTGSSVLGAALGMDKVLAKKLCEQLDVPIIPFIELRENQWIGSEEKKLSEIEQTLAFPVVVKPSRLGSSVGIAKANNATELDHAIEEALRFDDKILIEKAIVKLREINCSVLGDSADAMASVLEEPIHTASGELLSYQDKYQRGNASTKESGSKQSSSQSAGMASLDRLIPAPIDAADTSRIQEVAVRIFQSFECAGVARIDFILDDESKVLYFNEINTIPGSFSFYLWEPSGINFTELTDKLIEIALKRHHQKNARIRSYDTNLLASNSLTGLKGTK